MARRLVFQFPKNYDASDMGKFVYAINQVLADLENSTKGISGGEAQAQIRAAGTIVITQVTNDLPIGRGVFFEIATMGPAAGLTGMSGGTHQRIVLIKNSSASSHSLPILHESGSRAGNQFITRNSSSIVIPINGARAFVYATEINGVGAWLPLSEVP